MLKDKLFQHQKLSKYVMKLKFTSYDKAHKEYMTEDTRDALKFDSVKEYYISDVHVQGFKSIDAITGIACDTMFIEFKNGNIDNENIDDIHQKIRDSIDIVKYFLPVNDEAIRDESDFIFVLNLESSVHLTKQDLSPSLLIIKRRLTKLSKTEYGLLGLQKYKGKFFKNVKIMSKEEFNDMLKLA